MRAACEKLEIVVYAQKSGNACINDIEDKSGSTNLYILFSQAERGNLMRINNNNENHGL
jgi:TPP-dependent trihydroxycyclohexane-1,2-dione (THcHDO) dehydratase